MRSQFALHIYRVSDGKWIRPRVPRSAQIYSMLRALTGERAVTEYIAIGLTHIGAGGRHIAMRLAWLRTGALQRMDVTMFENDARRSKNEVHIALDIAVFIILTAIPCIQRVLLAQETAVDELHMFAGPIEGQSLQRSDSAP